MWLFETYQVQLPKPVLVKGEPGQKLAVDICIDQWRGEALLQLKSGFGRIKQRHDGQWYYLCSQLQLTVFRREELSIEPEELAERLALYQESAMDIAERLALFLSYKSRHSLLQAITQYDAHIISGEPYAAAEVQVEPLLERFPSWLSSYVKGRLDASLAHALLASAEASLALGERRRAVIELCMACEAALGMRILTLGLAKASIGEAFRTYAPQDYDTVIALFEARDAFAAMQRGQFRFPRPEQQAEGVTQLQDGLAAAGRLCEWLTAGDLLRESV